ncbi:MAG TPA: hypothetical protein VFJ30_13675 [Phycisphaerae bacterium]|nr:hypothetical protein [Phycisphaerae bacterium]
MIAKMKKVFVVSPAAARERTLEALRDIGVVHLEPVDPKAGAPEDLLDAIDRTKRALRILEAVVPGGGKPDVSPADAVAETLRVFRRTEENHHRLGTLAREVIRLRMWGDVRREQLDALAGADVPVRFYSVPAKRIDQVQAECVAVVGNLPGKRRLTAVIHRDGEPELPEDAQTIELPDRDLPTVRAEARETDEALAADADRLGQLARLVPEIEAERARLAGQAEFAAAANGALVGKDLWAVQGWVPAAPAETLAGQLAERGIRAGVDSRDPTAEEEPPTLIEYPRLVRPIKGLFDMLGTVAGYKEFDVSIPFMIALPIFAAMLIGDGAYGAILLLGPLLLYRKATKALGVQFTRLVMVIGAAAVGWGLLNGSFFGVVLYTPLIPVDMSDESRNLVMRITFFMAAIHLSLAQLWRGVALWPSLKALGRLGWAIFIWGMLGVVQYFVLNQPLGMFTYLLAVGAALAILFEEPSWNPLKMLGLGLANFPLSMLSAFSDVISYVRLMAVGLASGVMAASFNDLALSTGSWALAVPILIFGHGLNIGLAMIAIFAHGVRLNMLEFSNNLGMQWTGRDYQPFAEPIPEEIRT